MQYAYITYHVEVEKNLMVRFISKLTDTKNEIYR